MAVHTGKHTDFGFKLQSAKGSYIAPDLWLPHKGETIEAKKNYVFFEMADRVDGRNKYYSAGEWAEGGVVLPLVPGYETALLSWIMDRDGDNEGEWASILIDTARVVKKLTDAKVRTASFRFEKGSDVDVTLDVGALLYEDGTAGSPTVVTADPFHVEEIAVELEKAGGGYASDTNLERITVEVDNVVEEMAEGMRLRASAYPLQQYNLSGQRVSVPFGRDFVDDDLHDDFLAGTEASMRITCTRGCDVCTFTMPRLLYIDREGGAPATREERIVEGLTVEALWSVDGATPPLAIAA